MLANGAFAVVGLTKYLANIGSFDLNGGIYHALEIPFTIEMHSLGLILSALKYHQHVFGNILLADATFCRFWSPFSLDILFTYTTLPIERILALCIVVDNQTM